MSIEDDILIENYLKGNLSEAEREAFQERLLNDAEFQSQFELEKQLFSTLDENSWSFVEAQSEDALTYEALLQSNDIQSLKKTLIEAQQSINSTDESSTNYRRIFYYLAAASVVIFLGFQFFLNQSISNEVLYNDYIELDDLPSLVSRNTSENKLSEAQKLFESKDYIDALILFEEELKTSDQNANILIYMGITYIEIENFGEAEKTFNTLINSDLLDAQKGYWYKALLYLKQDKVEEARNILNKIKDEKLFNFENASSLLEELD